MMQFEFMAKPKSVITVFFRETNTSQYSSSKLNTPKNRLFSCQSQTLLFLTLLFHFVGHKLPIGFLLQQRVGVRYGQLRVGGGGVALSPGWQVLDLDIRVFGEESGERRNGLVGADPEVIPLGRRVVHEVEIAHFVTCCGPCGNAGKEKKKSVKRRKTFLTWYG